MKAAVVAALRVLEARLRGSRRARRLGRRVAAAMARRSRAARDFVRLRWMRLV